MKCLFPKFLLWHNVYSQNVYLAKMSTVPKCPLTKCLLSRLNPEGPFRKEISLIHKEFNRHFGILQPVEYCCSQTLPKPQISRKPRHWKLASTFATWTPPPSSTHTLRTGMGFTCWSESHSFSYTEPAIREQTLLSSHSLIPCDIRQRQYCRKANQYNSRNRQILTSYYI